MTMQFIATSGTLSGSQAYIDFNSIPQTFTHLQARGFVRETGAVTDNNTYFQLNGDTGTNYFYHFLYGTGSTASSGGTTGQQAGLAFRNTGASSTSGIYGVGVLDILDYTNTNKNKVSRAITGHDQNGSGFIFLWSAAWLNTSAITSMRFLTSGSNFAAGSRIDLYGITTSDVTGA